MSIEPGIAERRNAIRTRNNTRRRELTSDGRTQSARLLAQRLLPLVGKCLNLGVYSAVRGEISLSPLIELLPTTRLHWPKVVDNHNLLFIEATPSELSEGVYGILEPPRRVPSDLALLDAILVPGSAFSRDGGRLGMGGGYYDRILPLLRPDCLTIGVGYDWQVQDSLPLLPHDHKMTCVVTDQQTLLCEPLTAASGETP